MRRIARPIPHPIPPPPRVRRRPLTGSKRSRGLTGVYWRLRVDVGRRGRGEGRTFVAGFRQQLVEEARLALVEALGVEGVGEPEVPVVVVVAELVESRP
jgi:hypothetical protein